MGPKSKKGVLIKGKKWHWNWNNASFNWATTKIFPSTVSPELGACENVVLTWPLSSQSLFTGLFFTLKSPFLAQKMFFFINFIRILWFVFGNILGFPGVNWVQKWTKTIKFAYVSFLLKHLILKDCSATVFVLWETTSGQNFSKVEPYLGEKRPRNPPNRSISWMLHCHKNIW